jgi:hypothetical protein
MTFSILWVPVQKVRSFLAGLRFGQARSVSNGVPDQPATTSTLNPPHSAFGILVAPLGRDR